MLYAVASQELVPEQPKHACSGATGEAAGGNLANEAEMFPGNKCEGVKTSLLSAEQTEKGEQGATSLQLYAQ